MEKVAVELQNRTLQNGTLTGEGVISAIRSFSARRDSRMCLMCGGHVGFAKTSLTSSLLKLR